ncbi:MAG: SRPBCC family protein [Chloroflexota bacterium]
MILQDSTIINAPATAVFSFFDNMADNYTRWHPDHHSYRWVEGNKCETGAIFAFDETVGGERQQKEMRFTNVTVDRYLEFEPTNRFIRLLMPRLSFGMEPVDSNICRFEAKIHLRIGPIAAWLNRREFNAVRQHMREEAENIKQLVEAEMVESPVKHHA